ESRSSRAPTRRHGGRPRRADGTSGEVPARRTCGRARGGSFRRLLQERRSSWTGASSAFRGDLPGLPHGAAPAVGVSALHGMNIQRHRRLHVNAAFLAKVVVSGAWGAVVLSACGTEGELSIGSFPGKSIALAGAPSGDGDGDGDGD